MKFVSSESFACVFSLTSDEPFRGGMGASPRPGHLPLLNLTFSIFASIAPCHLTDKIAISDDDTQYLSIPRLPKFSTIASRAFYRNFIMA